jgi:hypothetical protein
MALGESHIFFLSSSKRRHFLGKFLMYRQVTIQITGVFHGTKWVSFS